MDLYQQYIHMSRYSRWSDTLGRRETWDETVQRYVDFFDKRFEFKHTEVLQGKVKDAILKLEAMPSMRALMTAGEALDRENIAAFNCSYMAVNTKRSMAEALYVLLCGTGVGFSCERQEVAKLPAIPEQLHDADDVIVVGDSKLGWAKAYNRLLSALWDGDIPKVDYSKVRKAGERLKVFGGRASGPAPLKKLFTFTVELFKRAKGRKLNSLEVHDLMCMIGEIVVVGGVRRSALISLSNLSDQRMRDAKSGQWWTDNPQRALANNSVAYTEKPSAEIFLEEWLSLVKSKSGERGIFNRGASAKQAERWGRRPKGISWGTNPCSEIILQDKQLCNLSEVVIRAEDTLETLMHKVEIATILGTMQSSLTKFGFVSETWTRNTIDEALLGVSLTGIMDNKLMSGAMGNDKLTSVLNTLRDHARSVNAEWAALLDVKPSAAITCVKPSGCTGLDTEIKTADGNAISMATLFEASGYASVESLAALPPQTWITPAFKTVVLDENNQEQEITKLFVNGMQPVYDIEFEDGKSYRFTGNHKLKTLSGWKRVDELTEQDTVVSY